MNYRHAFHAGNAADAMKHAILAWMLARLQEKPAPFFVLDTHAGIGLYDLEADEALRTGEAEHGIRPLMRHSATAPPPALLAPYLHALGTLNGEGENIRLYPGSPSFAHMALRAQDRMVLCELHPDDAAILRKTMPQGDRRIVIRAIDGWVALKAQLPPQEKRGLVIIDPPFETPDDYQRLTAAVAALQQRWGTGQALLWYPIKDQAAVWRLHQELEDLGIPRILVAEIVWAPFMHGGRLAGSGVILVNPPWPIADLLPPALAWLTDALGKTDSPSSRGWTMRWIRDENGRPG
jgi:23S rRNA (adenine2030-N6)-methyltransferase